MSMTLLGAGRGRFIMANPDSGYTVSVEDNGWVLAVRGTWPATSGAWNFDGADRVNGQYLSDGVDQFPLDPNGTPKVVLSVRRNGFTRSGGQAVPSVEDVQPVVATKALRRPYPLQSQIDETDNGDGTRTVRLALSDRIYDGDVLQSVTFAGGWKAGEAATTLNAATNNSNRAQPFAITRWAQPSYTLVKGQTTVEFDVIAASHHPRHFGSTRNQALAGIKFTATDGTTTKEFWCVQDRVSSQYDDDLLCWGATLDLTGLSAGPITIHRTDYPWVGQSRSTGSGQSVDSTNGERVAWASPLVICYDPDGTLYPHKHIYIDPVNGTTTAASVTVADTLALAKAGTAAKDLSTAATALGEANFSLPARNGWAADSSRAADWCVFTLAEGVSSWGSSTPNSGLACNEGRVIVQADPDATGECIWRTGSTAPTKRISRFLLSGIVIEGGEATLSGGLWLLDKCEVRGKPGFESATTGIFSGAATAGYATLSAMRTRWWKYGGTPSGSNTRALLFRNFQSARTAEAIVHIHHEKIEDPLASSRDYTAFGGWYNSSAANSDAMIWNCRAMNWNGRLFSMDSARSAGSGTSGSAEQPVIFTRYAAVNILCERTGGNSGERLFSMGEGKYEYMQDCVLEGITGQGNGFNGGYNQGPTPYVQLYNTGNALRNCVFGRHATKHDIFVEQSFKTASWEYLFGVGFQSNVNGNMNASEGSNFQFAHFGLRSVVDTNYDGNGSNNFLKFVSDKSDHGPEAPSGSGGGDYRPAAGSPLRSLALVACTNRDLNGTPRTAGSFAAGALEP